MLTNLPPVIVIDDDPAFRAALEDALQSQGFRTCAIEPCGPIEPRPRDVGCALVVLDLFMAGRDGLGWIEFFGTLQRPPEVILISVRSEEFLNAAWAVAEARGIRVRSALKKPLDISDLVTLLRGAGAYGYGIALDDIGTSYSGLVRLAELPVSEIKIDRRLVQQARGRTKAREILESLMIPAETVGLAVTVEGVETKKDLEALAGHPQAHIQGFLNCPKVPLANLLDLAPKLSAHLAADTANINATVAAHD